MESWCRRVFAREGVHESVHLTEPAAVLLLSASPSPPSPPVVTTEAGSLAPALYEADAETGMLYRLTSVRCALGVVRPAEILVD